MAESYFDYLKIDDKLDDSKFFVDLDQLKFETDLIGFKKHISNTSQILNGNEILLKSIVPYLYEIKKRTCRLSELSSKLNGNIFSDHFLFKCVKIGTGAVILVASGAAILAAAAAALSFTISEGGAVGSLLPAT